MADNVKDLLESAAPQYDRAYIKNDINIDTLLDDYVKLRGGALPARADEEADAEFDEIVKKINELAGAMGAEAEKLPEEPVSDTKEFYRMGSVSGAPPANEPAEPENKGIKKARISSVKEYIQTSFDESVSALQKKGEDRVFVVSIPKEKFDEGVAAGFIGIKNEPLDELTFDEVMGDEPDEKELSRYFKDTFFKSIGERLSEIRHGETQHRYDREKDKSKVRQALEKDISRSRLRMFCLAVSALILVYMGLSQTIELPLPRVFSYALEGKEFALAGLAVFIITAISSLPIFKEAVYSVIRTRITAELLAAVFAILAAVQSMFASKAEGIFSYLALPAIVLYFTAYYRLELDKKVKADYKMLAFKPEKTCCGRIASPEAERTLCDGEEDRAAHIRRMPHADSSNFFTKSYQGPKTDKFISKIGIIIILAAIAAFVCMLVMHASVLKALTAAVVTMGLLVPASIAFIARLPYTAFSKKLKISGAAIIGHQAAENMTLIERLILSDRDLFPRKAVQIAGMKQYGDTELRELMVGVVSAMQAFESPLSSVMYEIIDGRKDLLIEPDEVAYFDEKGVKAYVDGKVYLIGNRAFMAENLIKIPADGVTEKITEGGKTPLFVAVNGTISIIFAMKYSENPMLKTMMKRLSRLGLCFLIKTNDPCLTKYFICEKYGVPEISLKVLPDRLSRLEAGVAPGKGMPDIITITKDVSSCLRAICAAVKISTVTGVNSAFYIASFVMGLLIAGFSIYTGGFTLATPQIMLLVEALWTVPVLLISAFVKQRV